MDCSGNSLGQFRRVADFFVGRSAISAVNSVVVRAEFRTVLAFRIGGFKDYPDFNESAFSPTLGKCPELSAKTRKVILSFWTPTNFRQGKYDTALPSHESVFNSWLNRWNKYSPIPFERESLPDIFPIFFDINTEIVQDSRSKFIGCVGEVTYRIMVIISW